MPHLAGGRARRIRHRRRDRGTRNHDGRARGSIHADGPGTRSPGCNRSVPFVRAVWSWCGINCGGGVGASDRVDDRGARDGCNDRSDDGEYLSEHGNGIERVMPGSCVHIWQLRVSLGFDVYLRAMSKVERWRGGEGRDRSRVAWKILMALIRILEMLGMYAQLRECQDSLDGER